MESQARSGHEDGTGSISNSDFVVHAGKKVFLSLLTGQSGMGYTLFCDLWFFFLIHIADINDQSDWYHDVIFGRNQRIIKQ